MSTSSRKAQGFMQSCVQWVPWAVVPASSRNLGVTVLCSLLMLSVFKIMCHKWWMDGWMNEWMSRTYWWNDTDRRKSEYFKRNLFHYHLVHHKSPIAWDNLGFGGERLVTRVWSYPHTIYCRGADLNLHSPCVFTTCCMHTCTNLTSWFHLLKC
jgi:hypothetical protein